MERLELNLRAKPAASKPYMHTYYNVFEDDVDTKELYKLIAEKKMEAMKKDMEMKKQFFELYYSKHIY